MQQQQAPALPPARLTSKKFGDTPCTNMVCSRGSGCTASDSFTTLWQWMRHTQELMCRSTASFTAPPSSRRA
jgi:hypothetical protein